MHEWIMGLDTVGFKLITCHLKRSDIALLQMKVVLFLYPTVYGFYVISRKLYEINMYLLLYISLKIKV